MPSPPGRNSRQPEKITYSHQLESPAVKGKFGDRYISGDYRFMDTWRRMGNQWLAVARQQTRVAGPPAAEANAKSPEEVRRLRKVRSDASLAESIAELRNQSGRNL